MKKNYLVILCSLVLITGCAAKTPSQGVHRQLITILSLTPDNNSAQSIELGEELYMSTKDQDQELIDGTSVHYMAAWALGLHYFRTYEYRMAFQMFDEVSKNIKKFKTDEFFIQQTCILYGGASMVRLNKNEVGKNIFAKLAISDGVDHRTAQQRADNKNLEMAGALSPYKVLPKGTVVVVDAYCKGKKSAGSGLIRDVLDAYSQVMPLSADCLARIKVD